MLCNKMFLGTHKHILFFPNYEKNSHKNMASFVYYLKKIYKCTYFGSPCINLDRKLYILYNFLWRHILNTVFLQYYFFQVSRIVIIFFRLRFEFRGPDVM